MGHKEKVVIDCDDAASELKAVIIEHLRARGVEVVDLAYAQRHGKAFYPEIGYHLAQKVAAGEADRGILMCGTGLGMAMIANKVRGVFAGSCHDVYSAERLKKSNDANVITLGARVVGPELAKMIVDHFLDSEFAGGGSTPKVDQMRQLESESYQQ